MEGFLLAIFRFQNVKVQIVLRIIPALLYLFVLMDAMNDAPGMLSGWTASLLSQTALCVRLGLAGIVLYIVSALAARRIQAGRKV